VQYFVEKCGFGINKKELLICVLRAGTPKKYIYTFFVPLFDV
jgi:hypothetical protein